MRKWKILLGFLEIYQTPFGIEPVYQILSCFEKNEKQPTFIFANFINCMVTLTNKDKRIKKLENDLNQEKDTNKVLRKRIADLEKKRKNYLK